MTERDLGTYQMLWDCPYCGTDKLLGLDHRHCPSCGAAQDEDTRYFPKEEDRVAVEDHRYHGADRDCLSCSTPNAALAKHCVNCGMALEEAAEVVKVDERPKADAKPRTKKKKKKKGGVGCGTLILIAVVLFGGYLVANTCSSQALNVTVEGRDWERSIQVEQRSEVQRGGWCDSVPADAGELTRERRVRSQDKVPDGETCVQKQRDNGDGTFTAYEDCTPKYKSVDVYGDWCSWTGTDWFVVRTETAKGSEEPPAWPPPRIARPGDCVGCEREGARSATHTVHLRGGADQSWACTVDEQRFGASTVGSKWHGEAGGLSGNLRCDTLAPGHQ